jgi:hypothetical protein
MRRLLIATLVLNIVLAGCGGSSTTPEPLPVKHLPVGVQLNGRSFGDGQRVGDYIVWLSSATEPGVGDTQLDALLLDKNDQPVIDANVSFDLDMTNMSHGKNIKPAEKADGGHYVGRVRFMMSGPWRVIVVVERANQTSVSARFNFNVK